jgi:toxin ParE1/3/4
MRIRWTQTAATDLTQICDYIEKHGSTALARRVALFIWERIATLAKFPEQGRMGRKAGTREMALPGMPYIVIYRMNREAVEILRVLHGAQQWP